MVYFFFKMIVKIPQFVKTEALWNRSMVCVAVSVWRDWQDRTVQSWTLVLVCVIFSYSAYITIPYYSWLITVKQVLANTLIMNWHLEQNDSHSPWLYYMLLTCIWWLLRNTLTTTSSQIACPWQFIRNVFHCTCIND